MPNAPFSRRRFVSGISAAVAAVPYCISGTTSLLSMLSGCSPSPEESSLKEIAHRHGFVYGAAATKTHLSSDPSFAASLTSQSGILVPEVELKWDTLRPTPESFNFQPVDWLHNFADQNHMKFRGHPLVWYQSLPKWFDSHVTHQNAREFMINHISTVCGRYSGKMHSWDVVNEALDPNENRPYGLRSKPWVNLVGPDYIDDAFRAAAEADPNAMLVWNENHLETREDWAQAKRERMIENLKLRLGRGVPIHAVGLQSHLPGTSPTFNNPEFVSFLQTVTDLGVKVIVSELDVIDSDLPEDIEARDRAVANVYYDYLSAVLRSSKVPAVLTWGISDRYSWISAYKPRKDNARARPLPLDENLQPSPVWSAMARAFEESGAQ
jgi:endo-1,4-beta-xylanase